MLKISDEIASYVTELFPDTSSDNKIIRLIENEFIRKLARYQHTIRNLEMKYKMDFNMFKEKNIIEKKGYSFEVENDFSDWEMALGGIKTIERKLKKLREKKMNIESAKEQIIKIGEKFRFINSINLIDETDFAVKFRFEIDNSMFIQIYPSALKCRQRLRQRRRKKRISLILESYTLLRLC
nr:hypothetical protein [candidate division KSB1 bacterium]